jgi:hypothetical protein
MLVRPLLEWLANTTFSAYLRESPWAYPIVETVHVLTLCLFLGFTMLLDLRLLGIALGRTAASEATRRLEPWMLLGFASMLLSGGLLFASDPIGFSQNAFLRIKLGIILLAGLNVWIYHVTVYRSVADWDTNRTTPWGARAVAICSLLFWAGIVAMGRAIAYVPADLRGRP